MPTFLTTIVAGSGDTTGIEIPGDVVASLGGKRVPVTVSIGDYSYSGTTAVMGGRNLVSLAKVHRAAAGVAAGDEVEVRIERDDAPREVEVPQDLAASLTGDAAASAAWDALAFSRRKEYVRQLTEAKTDATRERRLEKVLAALR